MVLLKPNPSASIVPLQTEHAERMFQWMCDPIVSANIGLRQSPSLEKTRAWIANAIADASIRAFAIHAAEQHVGNVVLDVIDPYLGSARLSIYIGESAFRHKHVGASAAYLAAKEGFERENLNKIWLTAHVRNQAAITTYHNLGFVIEGILREEFWLNGSRVDVFRMSLLRREFAEIKLDS
jgi:RimJ/RimL family protein N-acetyltransferase